jgi:hypothetical protein
MSTAPPRQYEFGPQQNTLFAALASNMRGVGFFLVVLALLNLLVAVVVIITIYRAKLPQDYVDTVLKKVSEATKTDVKDQLSHLPPDNHLWGIAISSGVNFLIYLLLGMWTQSAASSFRKIVDTTGSDVSHLMDALSSLNKMYGLVRTLIIIGLLVLLVAICLAIYAHLVR